MRIKKLFIILILSLVLLPATPVLAEEVTVDDIAKQLVCPWNMILANCTDPDHRGPMIALIEQKLAQGQSEAEIIQFFVDQYGEQVLASPPKRGFNLTAWVTPFVAILAGGVAIYLALKKWVKRGSQPQATAVPETEEEKEKYQRRLDQELKEFTERGFR